MTNLTNNAQDMKKLTWGHEIEMTNINSQHAIKIVRDYYRNKYGCTNNYERGHGWTQDYIFNDGIHQGVWSVHRDGSVSAIGEGCTELGTPIMRYEDIEDMQAIIRLLRQEGAKSGQRWGCGAHIHIGANCGEEGGSTANSLRNLINIMASHQDLIFKACKISTDRYDGGYCKRLPNSMVEKLNRVKPRTIDGVKALYGEYCDRYYALNYKALDHHKTTEFRLWEYHGNLHAGEFKAWLQLSLAMANYARMVSHCSSKPVDMTNEKHAMRQWLNNLGLIGDEFKTCRLLMLKRLNGDSAYLHARVPNAVDDMDIAIN